MKKHHANKEWTREFIAGFTSTLRIECPYREIWFPKSSSFKSLKGGPSSTGGLHTVCSPPWLASIDFCKLAEGLNFRNKLCHADLVLSFLWAQTRNLQIYFFWLKLPLGRELWTYNGNSRLVWEILQRLSAAKIERRRSKQNISAVHIVLKFAAVLKKTTHTSTLCFF